MQGSKETPDSAEGALRTTQREPQLRAGSSPVHHAERLAPLGSGSQRASVTKPDGVMVVLEYILASC